METHIICDECGCFSTKTNVWPVASKVVCAYCFMWMTHESPYAYLSLGELEDDENEFDQILREIDYIRQDV